MDRRRFLQGLGCSLAAHPALTRVTLAAVPGENRLVVLLLRGAMDGLDAVRPAGDPGFAAARPDSEPGADLDGFFALHPGLAGLLPLWRAGELAFVHATSTPYRDKRSHFDGQELLEAGTGDRLPPAARRDGWLNRALGLLPGARPETAWAVGGEALPILRGAAPARGWSPDQDLTLSDPARALLGYVYAEDPLFRAAADTAFALTAAAAPADPGDPVIAFIARRLRAEARIAAFSLTGWDTHQAQARAIRRPLDRLQGAILGLRAALGPEVWGRTLLLAMTEFGRTVRLNGTRGTDHGTGGVMLAAGGAVRGGQVLGRWPGLAEADLFDRRDLMPTSDLRDWAAEALAGLFGLDRPALERVVFPGLARGATGRLLR
jgi:uncharacterized protein (DUF1501 family)